MGTDTVQKLYTNLFQNLQIPEDTIIQFTLWASPRIEIPFERYRSIKEDTSPLVNSIETLYKALETANKEERKVIERDISFLQWLLKVHEKRKDLRGMLENYGKFLKQKTREQLTTSWKASLKDFHLFISVAFPVKSLRVLENPKQKEKLWKLKEMVLSAVKVAGIPFVEMDAKEYVKAIRYILHPSYSTEFIRSFPYVDTVEIRDQLLFEGTIIHQYDNGIFALDGFYFRTLTVPFGYYGYPKEVSFLDVMEFIGSFKGIDAYQITIPFLLSFVTKKMNDKEYASLATQGNMVLNQALPGIISRLKERKEDFTLLMQKKQEEHEALWWGILTATFYSKDRDNTEENAERFQQITANLGYRFLKEEIPLPFFIAQLPLNAGKEIFNKPLARSQAFLAENCSHLAPVSADWKGTETPVVPLISRRGQLMFLHLWDTDGGSNYAIVAPMGAGKSFFSNHLLFNYALLPNSLIRVIDIGESYFGLCELLGGRYERFSVSKSCINPFHFIDPSLKGEGLETQISFLTNLMLALGRWTKKPTDEERGLINQALLIAIEKWGSGFNLIDVVNIMREIAKRRKNKDLIEFAELAFTPWLPSGQYGGLFNGEPTLRFDNNFIVLELGEARDDYHLLAIVLITYLFMTTKEIMTLPRNVYKILHIDEAWRVFQTKHYLVFDALEQGIREYRKFGGALGIVTQSIKDLFPTDNDPISQKIKAMRSNTFFFFLFQQGHEEWERMLDDKDVPMTEFDVNIAKTIKTVKGEYSEMFVITRHRGKGIARLVLPKEFYWLYTTDSKEVQTRKEIYLQTKDIRKTIEILVSSSPQR